MEFVNHPVEWKNPGVEPPNDLKDTGFTAGYKPPAGYFNYLFHVAYLVAKELQEKFQDYPDDFLQALEGKADKDHTHDLATENNDGFMSKEMVTKLAELIASGGGGVDDYLLLKNRPNLVKAYDGLHSLELPFDVSMNGGFIRLWTRERDPNNPEEEKNFTGNGIIIGGLIDGKNNYFGGYKKSLIYMGTNGILSNYKSIENTLSIGQMYLGNMDDDSEEATRGSTTNSVIVGDVDIGGSVQNSMIIGKYGSTRSTVIMGKVMESLLFGNHAINENSFSNVIPENCIIEASLIGGAPSPISFGTPETRIVSSVSNSIIIGYECGFNTDNSYDAYMDSEIRNCMAVGRRCYVQSEQSYAIGDQLIASQGNFVIGYNNKKPTRALPQRGQGDLFVVGNGLTDSSRSNAFRVTQSSGVYGTSSFNSTGADYAEMFEWLDGNPDGEDRRGLFVTLDGEKVRLASSEDDYILGVVSAAPSVVGDNFADDWNGKYLCDVYGQRLLQDVEVPDELDDEGNVRIPAHVEKRWILNPDFNPKQDNAYIPRDQRPEWAAVGMMGKLIVRDDGSCQVNGFCMPGENGIATSSKTGFRVMKRLDDTHVKILLK